MTLQLRRIGVIGYGEVGRENNSRLALDQADATNESTAW